MPNHGKNLRKGRQSLPGYVYVVTAVTRNRKSVFLEFESARLLISTFRHADSMQWSRTLAFVVMPDHFHWLLQLGHEKSLSQLVESVKKYSGRTARKIDDGGVWQSGFHDHAIRSDEDMRAVARYIIANPLRAGLVERIGDYAWWDAVWVANPGFQLD